MLVWHLLLYFTSELLTAPAFGSVLNGDSLIGDSFFGGCFVVESFAFRTDISFG